MPTADRRKHLRPATPVLFVALSLLASACVGLGGGGETAEPEVTPEPTIEATPDPELGTTPDELAMVDPAVDAIDLVVTVDPKGLILTGKIPDDASRLRLNAAALTGFVGGEVIDELQVMGVEPSEESDRIIAVASESFITLSTSLRLGTLAIEGTALRIQGSAYDRAAAASLDMLARDAAGMDDSISLSIPEPGTESALQSAFNDLDLDSIQFATGTADLSPGAQTVLGEIAVLLNENPRVEVRVEGHTDGRGEAEDNLVLSQERAESVVSALAGLGVDTARLIPRGFGEERPLADNASEEGQAVNRRVELIVVID